MADQKSLAVSLGLAAGIVYLAAHAVIGEHGLVAFVGLQAQEAELNSRLNALTAEREALQAQVDRLRDTVDLDYLDERARLALGAAGENEIVFAHASP